MTKPVNSLCEVHLSTDTQLSVFLRLNNLGNKLPKSQVFREPDYETKLI